MYARQKSHLKFKSLISDKILRCRSIFSIYSKLGMELHHLYILIKKNKHFENSKLSINMHDL